MSMIYINEASIVGQIFTATDPATEYTCVGYACNDTFLIMGAYFDAPNNRTSLKTFKIQDVKFKGKLTPVVK